MKFSTFFNYQFWKIAVGVWNIKNVAKDRPSLQEFNFKKMVSISVISASVAILKMFYLNLEQSIMNGFFTNVYINTILQIRKFLANATGYVNQPVFSA
jgi:hypothetical protein